MDNVYESVTVYVNDKKVADIITPPYAVEIGKFVDLGVNKLVIEVATTLERDQMNYPQHPFVFIHDTMEPTGMYGTVKLTLSN